MPFVDWNQVGSIQRQYLREVMGARNHLSAIKNKGIIAFGIISVLVLLYLYTSAGGSKQVEEKKRVIDTSKCETATFTEAEVTVHNKCSLRDYESNDWWIVVDGYVFDVSEWIIQHPGGEAICLVNVKTGTKSFRRAHVDWENLFTNILKPKYCIGKLALAA